MKDRFDSAQVIFIKRLLQVELAEEVRKLITANLFNKYVTYDEKSFAKELYMDLEQLKYMSRNGMYIGSHGFDHFWLDRLSTEKQESEIDESIKFLELVNKSTGNWVICYPYGAYNDSLIGILKKKGCAMGFTTYPNIANITKDNAYTLARLDTNDFPKLANSKPNTLTMKLKRSFNYE